MNVKQCALDIFQLATQFEDKGNGGWYHWMVEPQYRYVLSKNKTLLEYRRGILYYTRGWGWRVRKKPHWKEVYKERFSQWYQPVDPASD